MVIDEEEHEEGQRRGECPRPRRIQSYNEISTRKRCRGAEPHKGWSSQSRFDLGAVSRIVPNEGKKEEEHSRASPEECARLRWSQSCTNAMGSWRLGKGQEPHIEWWAHLISTLAQSQSVSPTRKTWRDTKQGEGIKPATNADAQWETRPEGGAEIEPHIKPFFQKHRFKNHYQKRNKAARGQRRALVQDWDKSDDTITYQPNRGSGRRWEPQIKPSPQIHIHFQLLSPLSQTQTPSGFTTNKT